MRSTPIAPASASEAKVKVSDGEMPVYFARPANAPNPPVILVAMEIFGLHEYIKDVTRRLGKLGAFAIAPDYYFRKGVDLTKITEIPQLMPIVNAKPDAELLSDLDATVAWAKSQGGDTSRLGIMGFCRGGRTVWEYAGHNKDVKAGVAFYGSLVDPPAQKSLWPKSPIELAPDMKAPVLGLYGERHPCKPGRHAEGGAASGGKDLRDQGLSRRAARLPCRLSRQLPPGCGRGRLEPDDRLVQKVQSAGLTPSSVAATRGASRAALFVTASVRPGRSEAGPAAASPLCLTSESAPALLPARPSAAQE
jgi:dienelactone hydrolase